jgi:hypothetical protein
MHPLIGQAGKECDGQGCVSGCRKQNWHSRFFWITDNLPFGVMASNIWHTSGMW